MGANSVPKHLKADGRRLWKRLVDEYVIDDQQGLVLLEVACEALDRQKEASEAIKAHGIVIVTDSGLVKANPAAAIERDARSAMMAALKALRLDVEVISGKPGRPPG